MKTSRPAHTRRPPGGRSKPDPASILWEARLCELELHSTRLEMENQKLREACGRLQVSRVDEIRLYDVTPVGLATLDLRGVIQNINRTGAALLRLAKKQLLHRRFAFSVAPDDIPKFMAHLRRCLRSRKTVSDELRLRDTGTGPRMAQLSSAPILDRHSHIIGFQTTLVDATARKRVNRPGRPASRTCGHSSKLRPIPSSSKMPAPAGCSPTKPRWNCLIWPEPITGTNMAWNWPALFIIRCWRRGSGGTAPP